MLVWKTSAQNEFSAEVRRFIQSGVTKMEICTQIGSNAINCHAVARDDKIFSLVTSALSSNEPKLAPGHAIVSFESVIKLYRQDSLLCFRAVEFQQHEGQMYLESIVPDQRCETFKYGPDSVMAKDLSKALLEAGARLN